MLFILRGVSDHHEANGLAEESRDSVDMARTLYARMSEMSAYWTRVIDTERVGSSFGSLDNLSPRFYETRRSNSQKIVAWRLFTKQVMISDHGVCIAVELPTNYM